MTEVERTRDVYVGRSSGDFASLLLPQPLLAGLRDAGFTRPSPVQLQTIPLGRTGIDLLCQAKAGTGKTLVFALVALERLLLCAGTDQLTESTQPTVLIVAPTRELAAQIHSVILRVATAISGLLCSLCIGGIREEISEDSPHAAHVVVATPGRLADMASDKRRLDVSQVRLLVLDEADQLLSLSMHPQVMAIRRHLAQNDLQVIACSATLPETVTSSLTSWMNEPMRVILDAETPALVGVRQWHYVTQSSAESSPPHQIFEEKVERLLQLLRFERSFGQCIVFCNHRGFGESLSNILTANGIPTAYISGDLVQTERLAAMAMFRTARVRCLVSTDLSARGIDVDTVDMVVCMDMPRTRETHLHRIGRAGRFGTRGDAVVLGDPPEHTRLVRICSHYNMVSHPLPEQTSQQATRKRKRRTLSETQSVTQPQIVTKAKAVQAEEEPQKGAEVSQCYEREKWNAWHAHRQHKWRRLCDTFPLPFSTVNKEEM